MSTIGDNGIIVKIFEPDNHHPSIVTNTITSHRPLSVVINPAIVPTIISPCPQPPSPLYTYTITHYNHRPTHLHSTSPSIHRPRPHNDHPTHPFHHLPYTHHHSPEYRGLVAHWFYMNRWKGTWKWYI